MKAPYLSFDVLDTSVPRKRWFWSLYAVSISAVIIFLLNTFIFTEQTIISTGMSISSFAIYAFIALPMTATALNGLFDKGKRFGKIRVRVLIVLHSILLAMAARHEFDLLYNYSAIGQTPDVIRVFYGFVVPLGFMAALYFTRERTLRMVKPE